MQKLFLSFLFSGLCSLTLSCNKPDSGPEAVYPASRFSATIDGKPFMASLIRADVNGNGITIGGTRNDGTSKAETIGLYIPHYVTLTSYPIDTATSASYSGLAGIYRADSGSITVATYNEVHIAGTFSFVAADTLGVTKSITNGSFDYYR